MIAEIGHYALVLSLCLALIQATLPIYGARAGDRTLMGEFVATPIQRVIGWVATVVMAIAAIVMLLMS